MSSIPGATICASARTARSTRKFPHSDSRCPGRDLPFEAQHVDTTSTSPRSTAVRGVSAWLVGHAPSDLRLSGEIPFGAQDAVGCKSDAFVGRLSTNDGRSTAAPCHPEPDVPITALRDDDRRLVGGKRTSGYWSHRQCDAQIVSNLTSA